MLFICVAYCGKFCLDFNVNKSKVMIVGKTHPTDEICPLVLKGLPLGFVTEYKYLGVVLCGGKALSFSPVSTVRSFHRVANSTMLSL